MNTADVRPGPAEDDEEDHERSELVLPYDGSIDPVRPSRRQEAEHLANNLRRSLKWIDKILADPAF